MTEGSSWSDDEAEEFAASLDYTASALEVHNSSEADSGGRRGGSVAGHQVIDRSRIDGHRRLFADYFVDPSVYDHTYFHRRYPFSPIFF